jgi:hypothetical protein
LGEIALEMQKRPIIARRPRIIKRGSHRFFASAAINLNKQKAKGEPKRNFSYALI